VRAPHGAWRCGLLGCVSGAAHAQQAVNIVASPNPVVVSNSKDCTFVGDCIFISTVNNGSFIELFNSGMLGAATPGHAIFTLTNGDNAHITIKNIGNITTTGDFADGIVAGTLGVGSSISITNSGNIKTDGVGTFGITAGTNSADSALSIDNGGDVTSTHGAGLFAHAVGDGSALKLNNSGDLTVAGTGIKAATDGAGSELSLENSGKITITNVFLGAFGINAETNGGQQTHIEE
jgi:hypothetical protein